jgi:hypothetical protein
MNSHILLSTPIDIKTCKSLDNDFEETLKSCGIRSRNNSTDSMILPATDSFLKENKTNNNNNTGNIIQELYCAESENFPNMPIGKTPPDTSRIREFYMQYLSKVQLKESLESK